MNNSKDAELQQIARLRLARVLIDQGKSDEAIKTLAERMPAAFAVRYHEVRGDAFLAKKDVPGALTEYQAALAAATAAARWRRCWNSRFKTWGPYRAARESQFPEPNKAKP